MPIFHPFSDLFQTFSPIFTHSWQGLAKEFCGGHSTRNISRDEGSAHTQRVCLCRCGDWNALGSTLGWWFCLLGRRLGRRKQICGEPFPFRIVPYKIQLVPKTVSHTLYTTGTLHP